MEKRPTDERTNNNNGRRNYTYLVGFLQNGVDVRNSIGGQESFMLSKLQMQIHHFAVQI